MDFEGMPGLLAAVSTYGYVALFLVLFLEELGVPLPLPGDVALIFAGYLVSQGLMRFDLAVLTVVLAAISGASALYCLSCRYGRPLVIRYGRYIHLNERRLEWLEIHFRRFGPWAVVGARVTPGLRIYTSVLAGLSNVKYSRFAAAVGPSVIVWAVVFIGLGGLIGERSAELATNFDHHAIRIVAVILALSLVGALIWRWRARWARWMVRL